MGIQIIKHIYTQKNYRFNDIPNIEACQRHYDNNMESLDTDSSTTTQAPPHAVISVLIATVIAGDMHY